MQVEAGDFVSIIGPSGCGKSTMIRMLDGIIQPSGGELYLDGQKLDTSKKDVYKRQTPRLITPSLPPWWQTGSERC